MSGTLTAMTHVLVISDTHLAADHAPRLVERLGEHLQHADAILHAGDVTSVEVLGALSRFAPVHAVLGNNDRGVPLPERRLFDLEGCTIGMIHDSGSSSGRGARLHRMFPTADVVVFGHSHAPWNETDTRAADGHVQHGLNPGSAMQRRMQPHCTVAWLDIDNGAVTGIRHIVV